MERYYVPKTSQGEPSPWWLKGGAIFIGVLGFTSLIGAISLIASGFWFDSVVEEMDAEEICRDDPDPACEDLIESIIKMGDMQLWDVGAAASALLFIISIPTVYLMWMAEDRETGLKLAWTWVAVHAASQLYITHIWMNWLEEFNESIPDVGFMEFFVTVSKIGSYGSVIFCELFLAAGLAMITIQSRPQTKLDMPSAFHASEE